MKPSRVVLLVALLALVVVAGLWLARSEPITDAAAPAGSTASPAASFPVSSGLEAAAPAAETSATPREVVEPVAVSEPAALADDAPASSDAPVPIRLRCVDPDGAGIAGVAVSATVHGTAYERERLGKATTGADGRARYPRPAPPWDVLEVSFRLRPPDGLAWMVWRGPLRSDEIVVELAPGGGFSGTVSLADGSPVAERSDLALIYSIGPELEGRVDVDVEGGRYETGWVLAGELKSAGLSRPRERYLTLDLDTPVVPGRTSPLDVVFELGCACDVTLVDAGDGRPIAGAGVRFHHPRVGTTDDAGRVRIVDAIAPGRTVSLVVTHDDYPDHHQQVTCPDPATELHVLVEVDPGHRLSGVVQDARGVPLPDVEVRCERTIGSRTGLGSRFGGVSKRTRTDADGRFALRGFATATGYDITFLRGDSVAGHERVALPEASAREVWTLHDLVGVRGVVVTATGEPVPGAKVGASAAFGPGRTSVRADEFGAFELPGIWPDTWWAFVEHGDPLLDGSSEYLTRRVTGVWFDVHPTGAPAIEIRLAEAGGPVRHVPFLIRARDATTGAWIEHFDMLMMNGIDSTLSHGLGGGELGPSGFEHSIVEGTYDFFLRAQGYGVGHVEVTLEPAERRERIDFELVPEE